MKAYRLYIAVALSAACHAVMLLPGWSYTPASAMLRRGNNAVTLELVESVEAVARSAPEQTRPLTEVKQEIQRRVETATEQLAALVREVSKIKLPEPPPVPSKPQPPVELTPPEPVIEPVIEATRMRIHRSATDLAEQIKTATEQLQQATRECVAEQARQAEEQAKQAAEQARQAAMLAAAQPPPAPKVQPEQTRPDGNAEVNSRASVSQQGAQGVTAGAQAIGDIYPTYPPSCARRNEEGVVTLEWQVLANGKCGWVRIEKSSGNGTLDQAAVDAVKKAPYRPARSGGLAVDSVMVRTIRFEIIDRSS